MTNRESFAVIMVTASTPKSICTTDLKAVTTNPLVALVELTTKARLCGARKTARVAGLVVVDFSVTVVVNPITVLDLWGDVTNTRAPDQAIGCLGTSLQAR